MTLNVKIFLKSIILNKKFCKKQIFEIEFFWSCQNLNQLFYNASDFELNYYNVSDFEYTSFAQVYRIFMRSSKRDTFR